MNSIFFQEQAIQELHFYLDVKKPSLLLFLVDEHTHECCLPHILAEIATEIPIEILEIESGESQKTIETAYQLWASLLDLQADRQSLLINVGGGVITDLGGFVASTFMRGISFLNIPTTLLAMVDASVGGKTGIDLEHSKNTVGTFAQADLVLIFPELLQTLPNIHIRNGLAEMLKHGLIADEQHWNDLISVPKFSLELIQNLIPKSIEIKKNIVEKDYKEENFRKTLNFGHTIGHAIESYFLEINQPILHGEAVAIGMHKELNLAVHKNLLDSDVAKHIQEHLVSLYEDVFLLEYDVEKVISFIQKDKKSSHNELKFSLITSIGTCAYNIAITEEEVRNVL